MKLEHKITFLNEPSQKGIDAMNAWLKRHIDDDDLHFDVPIEDGNIKTMRLSEYMEYDKSHNNCPN